MRELLLLICTNCGPVANSSGTQTQFIPYLIQQHAQGKLPLEELIAFYPMNDFQKAIADVKAGKTVKAVLRWDDHES